ncbi:hypothetical protein [Derxia lacustris]|uniref:hypothetical protein n=1 Tax=Derxia lacustris TaxID=764842 RepID=UPI00111C145D|nr:hypothetical protein [Derxia lacustris]
MIADYRRQFAVHFGAGTGDRRQFITPASVLAGDRRQLQLANSPSRSDGKPPPAGCNPPPSLVQRPAACRAAIPSAGMSTMLIFSASDSRQPIQFDCFSQRIRRHARRNCCNSTLFELADKLQLHDRFHALPAPAGDGYFLAFIDRSKAE